MAEKMPKGKEKPKTSERLMRFGRDFNVVVGGLALAGAAIAPPAAAVALGGYGGLQFVQAAGFEAGRRYAKKRNKKTKN